MGRIVGDLQLLADVAHPQFLQPERIDLELFIAELAVKLSALAPRTLARRRASAPASWSPTGTGSPRR